MKLQRTVTKTDLAEVLGLTTRQITNLVEEGMPRQVRGNRVAFDLAAAVQWYVRYKEARSSSGGGETKKNLLERKLQLEVQMQEIELAKAQGAVVTLDYLEAQTESMLQRLRAKILNMPGKYSPAIVGLRSIAEGQARLEGISTELITALADTGEDPELDDASDALDGDGRVAA